jgi:hypothetical protein
MSARVRMDHPDALADVARKLAKLLARLGQLLYVSETRDPISWLARQRHTSPWFSQTRLMKIERFANRRAALGAKRLAIENERPLYNARHRAAS